MKLILLIAAIIACTLAAPLLKVDGEVVKDSYIVVFENHVDEGIARAHFKEVRALFASEYEFKLGHRYTAALNGFSAHMNAEALAHHLASEHVKFVEQDQMMYATPFEPEPEACTTQSGSTWGISRISRRNEPAPGVVIDDFPHEASWGQGVDVYIVDTGVYAANVDFGGRVVDHKCFASSCSNNGDGNGHGTHVASTSAGTTYGIAKKANIVSVAVLGSNGSGTNAGVIAGVDYVATRAATHPTRRATANMSLGGGTSSALDAAVVAVAAANIPFAVAAGNDNRNACNYSPARAGGTGNNKPANGVLTVGATTSSDGRSSFSNYGDCVGIFAPGSSITAAYLGTTATATLSGTSMASPHVCGALAAVLSEDPSMSAIKAQEHLVSVGTTNVISNIGNGSPNEFLYLPC